jgi:phosphoglycolate phosphatase-like HAD superfamily hydrolase
MSVKGLKHPIRLFWDIDGTLLLTHGAAAIPFTRAVSDYAGKIIEIDRKKLSGHTDYEIVKILLNSIGIEASFKQIKKILKAYTNELPTSLEGSSTGVIGNIKEIFTRLKITQSFELAIGTGNFYTGAKIKLNYVGLLDFFEDKYIFCATENNWSRDLVIMEAKESLAKNQVGIVIGDSPKDIISAKNAGLTVIAVSTGNHTSAELLDFNPNCLLDKDWTYEDLLDKIHEIVKCQASIVKL